MNAPENFFLNYNWPCWGIDPDYYQKLTSTFLVNNPHAFCLNDPGTGKTISSLWAADFIMSQFPREKIKCLILAPLSTLKDTWETEIRKHFFTRRKCAVVHGTPVKRLNQLRREVDFYIMNHDGVKVDPVANAIFNRPDIRIVIVDECTAFSDSNAARSKRVQEMFADMPIVWGLTGTPVVRGHLAAHGQARLIHPTYQESRQSFERRTTWSNGHRKEPTPNAYEAARELLTPAIRIPRRHFYSIPEAVPVPFDLPLTRTQTHALKELKKEYQATLASGAVISAVHESALRLKLLQIACGAVYDASGQSHVVDATPRLNKLIEVIEEAEGKTIVFVPFTGALENVYHNMKRKYNCAMINGKTSLTARSKIFEEFKTGNINPLIADPATMSHGLTLTQATVVCWYGPTDKAEIYKQAVLRIDRRGQKCQTYSVQFMSTPVEREIYKRLEHNQKMEGALLKLMEREQ